MSPVQTVVRSAERGKSRLQVESPQLEQKLEIVPHLNHRTLQFALDCVLFGSNTELKMAQQKREENTKLLFCEDPPCTTSSETRRRYDESNGQRAPMQERVPQPNVMFEYALRFSSSAETKRSGSNASALCPQSAGLECTSGARARIIVLSGSENNR